jgi:predicted anti-sigma-YlaC factor YlaD
VTNEIEQLSCQELVELVTDYLEGVLPEADRARIEEHISGCDGCRDYIDQMRSTVALSNEARPPGLTPEAEQALLSAFRDWNAR